MVIPSRNGKNLLAAGLPGVERDLAGIPSEILIVDNGSTDGTARAFPQATVDVSAEPLSFARAVNRGIARSRYSRVCLLNNDMLVEPGFFRALLEPFGSVPDLFCSTAQIFFPPGVRREETGKAVMAHDAPTDFPLRCDLPVAGEDHSYVLYGSGGCSLFDTAKLRALGAVQEMYEPAYVEDLDLGYRGWTRGWPTVFAAGAHVEHRHRATTSRYYTEAQLTQILEVNYLRFLAGAVRSPDLFGRLWREAIERLRLLAAQEALRFAWRAPLLVPRPVNAALDEVEFLALTRGDVAVFRGHAAHGEPAILTASLEAPARISPGAVVVCFCSQLEMPASDLLHSATEIVMVKLSGGWPAFRAAVHQTARKWRLPIPVGLPGPG